MLKLGLEKIGWVSSPRRFARKAAAVALSVGCLTAGALSSTPVHAEDPEWTITLLKHYNSAVKAYNNGDWATAQKEFRTAIGLNQRHLEFYQGLIVSGEHGGNWDQVAFGCEKLAEVDPTSRNAYAYDYGLALYHLNRYDEAITWLKRALAVADQPVPPISLETKSEEIVALQHIGDSPAPQPVMTQPVITAPPPRPKEKLNEKKYLDMETMIRSESIVLAEYEGYKKSDDIRFNEPPRADYHIEKIFKGPPLNRSLPVRYEFHDLLTTQAPAGWKFDEAKMMPEKGSKWILFIEWAVAKRGCYETYQGAAGRLPATDENMNKLQFLLDKYNMREERT